MRAVGSVAGDAEHFNRAEASGVPRLDAEFPEDAFEMRAHRVGSDAKDAGNFGIGLSLRDPD